MGDDDLEEDVGRSTRSARGGRRASPATSTYVDAYTLFADERRRVPADRSRTTNGDDGHACAPATASTSRGDGAELPRRRTSSRCSTRAGSITRAGRPGEPDQADDRSEGSRRRRAAAAVRSSGSGVRSSWRRLDQPRAARRRRDRRRRRRTTADHATTAPPSTRRPTRRPRPPRRRPTDRRPTTPRTAVDATSGRSTGRPSSRLVRAMTDAADRRSRRRPSTPPATSSTAARTQPGRARRPSTAGSRSPSSTSTRSLAYDLAHAASAVEGCAGDARRTREHGEVESMLALRVHRRRDRRPRRPAARPRGGVGRRRRRPRAGACRSSRQHRAPEFLESVARPAAAGTAPARATSPTTSSSSRDTFHRFADDKIRPVAEHVHRTNADIPEDIIAGLAELGGFGLSVPEEYGGFAAGGESDYLGMVVATEELSWGSLGVGGSLITRPEILTRAHRHGRHRGAEAARGCRASRPASSWSASWSPSPTTAPTSPA